jgi:integrase/recombinase XerD
MSNAQIIPAQNTQLTQQADLELVLDAWAQALALRVSAQELAENSAQSYKRGARRFVAFCQAQKLDALDPDSVREWKAALLKDYKPATVNAWLAGLKALYTWLAEQGQLSYNPAQNVKGAKRKGTNKRHARESLTDSEMRRLLALPDESAQGKRDAAILALMSYAALRQVEVYRADLSDLKTQSGRLVLEVQGKGRQEKDEIVVIMGDAEKALRDWISIRGSDEGALFTSLSNRSNGERLSLRAIRGIVKSYYKLAGIVGNKTTHSLRHTAITKAISNGVAIQKVKGLARHSSIETTMIYFHELDRLEDPAEAYISY